mmetsp:Transcript_40855/g.123107  ORF Transcript_40855/g.123107 Transcript_40855/m.123107 type:complete len:308 (-) Transcript_40855:2823-3746(-)
MLGLSQPGPQRGGTARVVLPPPSAAVNGNAAAAAAAVRQSIPSRAAPDVAVSAGRPASPPVGPVADTDVPDQRGDVGRPSVGVGASFPRSRRSQLPDEGEGHGPHRRVGVRFLAPHRSRGLDGASLGLCGSSGDGGSVHHRRGQFGLQRPGGVPTPGRRLDRPVRRQSPPVRRRGRVRSPRERGGGEDGARGYVRRLEGDVPDGGVGGIGSGVGGRREGERRWRGRGGRPGWTGTHPKSEAGGHGPQSHGKMVLGDGVGNTAHSQSLRQGQGSGEHSRGVKRLPLLRRRDSHRRGRRALRHPPPQRV